MVLLKKEISIIEGPRYMHLFDILFLDRLGLLKLNGEVGVEEQGERVFYQGREICTKRLEAGAMTHMQRDGHRADAVA